MDIHVITDKKGNIIATVQGIAGSHGDVPAAHPQPLADQVVHTLELPKELEGLRDAEQLHKRLKEHLKKKS
jgi:hypothetical protein